MRKSKKNIHLIETAKDLFMRFGIQRVTVEEICHVAAVSKVTFYKYFKNKQDLAATIRNDLMDAGFSAFDEISALDIPFHEKINRMTQWHMEFCSRMNNEFIRDLISMRDLEEEFKKRFLVNIQAAQSKGEIRTDLNIELIYLISKKLQEITLEGSWKTIFSEYGQYVEQARSILFFGMLTRA